MRRNFLLFGLITLIMTGCQYLPNILPAPAISDPAFTETFATEATGTSARTPTQSQIIAESPVPSASPISFSLTPQTGSSAYIQYFAHMDSGCDWLGVAGQIFDAEGKTINNLVVNVQGNIRQTRIDEIGLTGVPEADIYDPGGYEIKIADKAVDSDNSLVMRVLDLQGNYLSDALPFKTFSDCKKNLIIINFITK